MDWLVNAAVVLLAIVGACFVVQLLLEVWNQVIMGRYKITPGEMWTIEFCEVANQILGHKRKIEPGGWLSKEEFSRVNSEIKRRREAAGDE